MTLVGARVGAIGAERSDGLKRGRVLYRGFGCGEKS